MKIIDIHIHGLNGQDSRSSNVSDILNIAKLQGEQGISEIILSIYPAAISVMRNNIAVIKEAMDIQAERKLQDYSKGDEGFNDAVISEGHIEFRNLKEAIIRGIHLEGPFLNPDCSGALNAASFIEPLEHLFNQLIDGFNNIIKIITIAPELKGADRLIRKVTNMGIIVNMGHSMATYAQAYEGFKAGARGVTHLFNAMRPFTHREPGLVGFALTNKDIYVEVIADPFHLHQETINLIFGTKTSDKIIIVSDSVKETIISASPIFNKSPLQSSGRLLGGAMSITEAANRLINIGFPPNDVLKCISTNPIEFLSV